MKYRKLMAMAMLVLGVTSLNFTSVFAATPKSTSVGTRWGAVIDTTNEAEEFNEHMENIGFRGYLETIPTINDMNSTLLENNVLLFAGHGSADGVFFNYKYKGGDYATGVYNGSSREVVFEDDGEVYQMAGLIDYDLSDTVLAIFSACKTAQGKYNITKTAYNEGVDFSIGWRETIQTEDAEKWMNRFGQYLEDDMMLIDAMTKASKGGGYTDEDAIRNIGAFSSSTSINNLILSDYVNNYRSLSEALDYDNTDNTTAVTEMITYSFDEQNTENIEEYIKKHIDSQFDINRFNVSDYVNVTVGDSGDIYGTVYLDYKVGDFVTEDGYCITIKNNEVEDIFINGNPNCNRNDVLTIKEDIDEDTLKLMAKKEIELGENEKIVEQKIVKKYDTEPYYVVISSIKDTAIDAYRGESFEYHL